MEYYRKPSLQLICTLNSVDIWITKCFKPFCHDTDTSISSHPVAACFYVILRHFNIKVLYIAPLNHVIGSATVKDFKGKWRPKHQSVSVHLPPMEMYTFTVT